MKLTNLIWVLALAGSVAACNSGPPVQGCKPGQVVNSDGRCESESGSGGSTGGGGSSGEGACTIAEDTAVYAELEYTVDDGIMESGSVAASAIASDCVFGSTNSTPNNPGCEDQAGAVLACAIANNCTADDIQTLTTCVEDCQQELIMEITGSTLSDECNACYGASVSCSAALCATSGCSNPTSSQCIECRCVNGCSPDFDTCSGLAPSGDCDPYL